MRRSIRRDQSGLIWCAVATEVGIVTAAPSGTTNFSIVVMDNDVQNEAGQAHATLLRIRGWLHVVATEADVGITQYQGGVAVHDDDNPNSPESWTVIDTYTREDVLWTFGGGVFCPALLATGYDNGHLYEIDIKAKRRLRAGQNVTLSLNVTSDSNGPDLTVTGAIRGLVKLT